MHRIFKREGYYPMLLKFSWLLATSLIAVQGVPLQPRSTDEQVLASYKESGTCMLFATGADESGKEDDKGASPCKTWCPKHKGKDKTVVAVRHPPQINIQDS